MLFIGFTVLSEVKGQVIQFDLEFISYIKESGFSNDTTFIYQGDTVCLFHTKKYSKGSLNYFGDINVVRKKNKKPGVNERYHFDQELNVSRYEKLKSGLKNGWSFLKLDENYCKYIHYYEGEKHGSSMVFRDNILVNSTNFNSDTIDGHVIRFYPNGKIKEELFYKMGCPDGIYKLYSKHGELILNGKVKGYFISKFDNKSFSDVWYYLEDELKVHEVPEYIPKPPDNEFSYNKKYPKRIGEWEFLDDNDELVVIDYGY